MRTFILIRVRNFPNGFPPPNSRAMLFFALNFIVMNIFKKVDLLAKACKYFCYLQISLFFKIVF